MIASAIKPNQTQTKHTKNKTKQNKKTTNKTPNKKPQKPNTTPQNNNNNNNNNKTGEMCRARALVSFYTHPPIHYIP